MNLDNRFAALSVKEEAPGAQSEERALAPREAVSSESTLSASPAATDRDIRHAEESQSIQHKSAALQAQKKIAAVSKSKATSTQVNTSNVLTDMAEHVAPTGLVPLQTEFTFTCSGADCSSNATCLPTADSAFSNTSWFHRDHPGADAQKTHQVRKKSQSPSLGYQPFSVELSASDMKPADAPPAHERRGWPSPTNSPPGPTTRDRKSRFFPTSPRVSPEVVKLHPGAQFDPHQSSPLSFHSPNPAPSGSHTPTPSSTVKPRLKKSPPPPIVTSHPPLPSPIAIRQSHPHPEFYFNSRSDSSSEFQIITAVGEANSKGYNMGSGKNHLAAFRTPRTANEAPVRNSDLLKDSTAEYSDRPKPGTGSRERGLDEWMDQFEATLEERVRSCGIMIQQDLEKTAALQRKLEASQAMAERSEEWAQECRKLIQEGERLAQDAHHRVQAVERMAQEGKNGRSAKTEAWVGLERGFWEVSS